VSHRRVYYSRAVDGLARAEVVSRGVRLAEMLRTMDIELVDPVAAFPLRPTSPVQPSGGEESDLVRSDLRLLRTSHAVLMEMTIPDRNYIGCVCELTYAHLWGIPTVVWVGDPGYELRPWLRYHATAVFHEQREAVDRLTALLP
jgi:hypothetical protein